MHLFGTNKLTLGSIIPIQERVSVCIAGYIPFPQRTELTGDVIKRTPQRWCGLASPQNVSEESGLNAQGRTQPVGLLRVDVNRRELVNCGGFEERKPGGSKLHPMVS